MPKIPFPIRLDEEKVVKPLKKIAEEQNRTVANLIDTALMDFVKKFEKKK